MEQVSLDYQGQQMVRGRVLAWLDANPDMLDRDQIASGGG